MSRYKVKTMNLEMPKRLIIWGREVDKRGDASKLGVMITEQLTFNFSLSICNLSKMHHGRLEFFLQ
jgi:hypothetical protein